MEIQEIADVDFIVFKGGKDSIALEKAYPWHCSFVVDFYNGFLDIGFCFCKGGPCM